MASPRRAASSSSSPTVLAEMLEIRMSGGRDLLWVSLQHLERVFEGSEHVAERLSAFGDVPGLAEGGGQVLVLVDLAVELELQFVLTHAHQEVADGLRNRVAHGPQHDLEVRVDARAQVLDEPVGPLGRRLLLHLPVRTAGAPSSVAPRLAEVSAHVAARPVGLLRDD